jgi:hypothetical protein
MVETDEVGRCFTYPDRRLTISLSGDDPEYVYAVDGQTLGSTPRSRKELLVEATATAAGGLPGNVIQKLLDSKGGRQPDGETFTSDRAEATLARSDDGGWNLVVYASDAETIARFLSDNASASPERLARNFAPVFHFTEDENFKPVSIDALRGRAQLCEKADGQVDHTGCKSLDSFPDTSPCGSAPCPREWILDLPPDEYQPSGYVGIENELRHGSYARPVVYWHVADLGLRRVLSYWVYYLFNNFANIHEGDWETVQVDLVGGKNKDTVGVARWFFSSHKAGDTRSCRTIPSNCRHPDVFVAQGSHANYFTPGSHDAVADCPRGYQCFKSPRDDRTERSEQPVELGDYQLVELKDPAYVGRYGRENLKARWLRHVPIPRWPRDAPDDPRARGEWNRTPLAPFETAVGDEPPANSWMVFELDD